MRLMHPITATIEPETSAARANGVNGNNKMRALIIEDDTDIADGLAATLKGAGYAVDVTSTLSLETVINAKQNLDLSTDILMDGSATLEVEYL